MIEMTASEFKAKCLRILDEVAASGEVVVITKRGKPVARLMPVVGTTMAYPQHSLKGTGRVIGDIVAPASDSDDWDANHGRWQP
jgi:prevent-host-death family protein